MRKKETRKVEDIFWKVGAYSVVFFAVFLVTLISASMFTPVDQTNAENTKTTTNDTGFYVDVASNSSVDLNVAAVASGQVVVGTDQITTRSNCTSGFRVYMSVDSDTYDGLYLNGDTTETTNKFSASSGTPTQPIKLATNTWGFAIPKIDGSSYGFNTEYVDSNGVSSTGATGQSIMNIDEQLFAGVPKIGNEVLVQSYDTAATSGVTQKIYYGVNATTALVSGDYTGKVVYTAVADVGSGETTDRIGISPTYQKTLDGSGLDEGRVTIETSFYGTSESVERIISAGGVEVKIGGKTCTNVQVAGPAIDSGSRGPINIICDTPTMLRYGTYDVVVRISDYGTYTLDDGYSYYIPWIDMKSAADGTYTMQQFTAKTCSEMSQELEGEPYTGTIADGDYAANTNVPEVMLRDARESDTSILYRIRALADKNCWMTNNLRLTLDDSVALTTVDSDINYNMDTGEGWDGTTTATRSISNPLKINGDVLGSYSTDSSTGIISWTPYVDTQENGVYNISWSSAYTGCADDDSDGKIVENECTLATSEGTTATSKYFGPNSVTGEEEVKAQTQHQGVNNALAEAARSYDDTAAVLTDGDGLTQRSGTYYNWYAATAGSGTWAMNTDWTDTMNSVCPANWQLPDGATGDSKSFRNLLITKYGLPTGETAETGGRNNVVIRKAPFSFVKSGHYIHYSGNVTKGVARYWSRESAANNTNVRDFKFLSSANEFRVQGTDIKAYGYQVRCVAR